MSENRKAAGQDYIYVCLACGNREKEFSVHDRHSKICQKCGNQSIKSTLVDTLMTFDEK